MAFTYDLTTTVGKMRLMTMDNQTDDYIFEDEELEAFYGIESSNLRRACALVFESIASNEAYILKRITSLDLQTDGPAVAAELRQRAKLLREQALESEAKEDSGAFDYAEWVTNGWQRRDALINRALRNQSE